MNRAEGGDESPRDELVRGSLMGMRSNGLLGGVSTGGRHFRLIRYLYLGIPLFIPGIFKMREMTAPEG